MIKQISYNRRQARFARRRPWRRGGLVPSEQPIVNQSLGLASAFAGCRALFDDRRELFHDLAGDRDAVLIADEVERDVERARDRAARVAVGPIDAPRLRDERDRAIDRAGVEQAIAEPARELLGDGRLAGAGGAVDRDDEAV